MKFLLSKKKGGSSFHDGAMRKQISGRLSGERGNYFPNRLRKEENEHGNAYII